MVQAKEVTQASSGRHFLSVEPFGVFLSSRAAMGFEKTKAVYQRSLKGQKIFEVNVIAVDDAKFATCEFYARGGLLENIRAPLHCLSPILPVVAKPVEHDAFRELNRLAHPPAG